jgi:dienelactone hydrolase
MCDRFAGQGYAVCAPALFDRVEKGVELGYTQNEIDTGRAYRMKLDGAKVMTDVEAAAKRLAGNKLGIVGYGFGGTVAWWGATRSRSFAASSYWYGGGIAGTRDERPHCPVQMHFGEKDASIPMTDVDSIRAAPRNRKSSRMSMWARPTDSAATSEAVSASPTTNWRNDARWNSSTNISADTCRHAWRIVRCVDKWGRPVVIVGHSLPRITTE